MFDHHATHVILAMAYICQNAVMRGSMEEAVRSARLSNEIDLLFPASEA